MRREIPLSIQVYHALFPFRAEGVDPATWTEHVRKNLVPELRHEVHMFYGDALAHTVEARFPGINYALPNHRERLRRFPHHRRLFEVFDELGLTPNEMVRLCDWEGTLWVKRKYEMAKGPIRETAGDYIFGGRAAKAERAKSAESREDDDGDEDEEEVVVVEGVEAAEDEVVIEADDEESQAEEHTVVSTAQSRQPPIAAGSRRTAPVNVASTGVLVQLATNSPRPEAARAAA